MCEQYDEAREDPPALQTVDKVGGELTLLTIFLRKMLTAFRFVCCCITRSYWLKMKKCLRIIPELYYLRLCPFCG